jgi:RNA polymerase-binding protein DksA
MDSVNARRYEVRLQRRRQDILATVGRLEKEGRELAEQRHLDWLDRAWDESETNLLDSLREGYARELGKIDVALDKISSGVYGCCAACHEPIEERRLALFPETEFCAACQETRERFEKAA